MAAFVSPLAALTHVSKPLSIASEVSTADAAPDRTDVQPCTCSGPPPTAVSPRGSSGVFESTIEAWSDDAAPDGDLGGGDDAIEPMTRERTLRR
jgi:hypothetical protein